MTHTDYIQGNTVRREADDVVRQRREADVYRQKREAIRRANERVDSQKRLENSLSMDAPYVIALTLALFVVLGMCIQLLRVQANITTRIKNIEAQEKILEQYTADNDALQSRIDAGIDLNDIYRVATEELGMVYANKSQIITYDKTPTEYVRQNANITE